VCGRLVRTPHRRSPAPAPACSSLRRIEAPMSRHLIRRTSYASPVRGLLDSDDDREAENAERSSRAGATTSLAARTFAGLTLLPSWHINASSSSSSEGREHALAASDPAL
jgi:hypothetical protein